MGVRNGELFLKKNLPGFGVCDSVWKLMDDHSFCPRLTLRLCKGRVSTPQPAKGSHTVTFYLFSRLQNNRDFNQVKAYRD